MCGIQSCKTLFTKKQIPHIPVDIEYLVNDEVFWNDVNIMLFAFKDYSKEYKYYSERHEALTSERGFSYLNSEICVKLLERLAKIELDILKIFDDDKFNNTYKSWKALHEKREISWINSIYNYFIQHGFFNGILYCGVQHGYSVINRVNKIKDNYNFQMNWKFNDLPIT